MVYVNQVPDPRAGGLVGAVLGGLQLALSFHSGTPPFSWVVRWRRWKVGVEWSRPWLLPLVLVFIPHPRIVDRQRWYSFRAGWRWDANWGRGGYIADIIVKFEIDNLVEREAT